jgi:heme exporter protein B
VNALRAALAKDARLHWANRAQIVAVFVFGMMTLLLFSFAIGPRADLLRPYAPSFLWLALLLCSTLALADSFHHEMQDRALEGLLLLPAPAPVLYYAKALANTVQLALLGIALVPATVVLYDAPPHRLAAVCGVIGLGAAGLSAPGTLYSAMTSQVRSRQTLLPVLLFPLEVPVLLAAVRSTSLLLEGDPMGQIPSWIALLVCFDALHWSLGGLLFGRVVEE